MTRPPKHANSADLNHPTPTTRRVTVSRLSQGPAVRLTGKWLSQLGFEAGTRVSVEVAPGRLVLTVTDTERT